MHVACDFNAQRMFVATTFVQKPSVVTHGNVPVAAFNYERIWNPSTNETIHLELFNYLNVIKLFSSQMASNSFILWRYLNLKQKKNLTLVSTPQSSLKKTPFAII